MTEPYVVVGAGPGGLAAIDTIRELGDSTPIRLISSEPAYSRMVLPYYMDGTIPEDQVYTASDEYLAKLDVEPLYGQTVASLQPDKVTLDGGGEVAFSKLLLATGSSATRPPFPGAELDGVFNLWTLDDAKNVLAKRGGEVAVIGAGFIAFTCLDALKMLASKVTVVEVEDRILPRMVDARAAGLVQTWLENKGVEFRVGSKVSEIQDEAGRRKIVFTSGDPITADVVVIATGVRPNLGFVQQSGLQVDFGVVVDDAMRTTIPKVFAAGDIAQGPVVPSQEAKEVHAIEPTALEHGRVAGANMAGGNVSYWGSLLMNIVDVQKLQIASFGRWQNTSGEVLTLVNENRPVYRKLVFEEDRLVGAVVLGRPDDVALLNDMGMFKGLIQTEVSLGAWRKYLDDNPLDIRRPYVASRAAEKLLERTLIGHPHSKMGFRNPDVAPKYWSFHDVFVKDAPKGESERAE